MTTPVWQPGTLYAPGSLVQPLSAIAPVPDPIDNGDFEAGNTGWTLDAGFSIGQFGNGTHFDGTWSLQWDATTAGRAINTQQTPVTPGQSITATGQVQQGASSAGQAGARVEIAWYDESDDLISYSSGNLVDSTSSQNWKQSSVTDVAPAGAAFARFSVYAIRSSGGDELWVDACQWNAMITQLPDGLVFRAVQDVAGYSASTEPVWPIVVGVQVIDNEVTWEAIFASRVEWEASPILVSGPYEPDFPVVPDGTVVDGSIIWTAMNFRVTDEKCPQGPVVIIAASKVFCADDDIIAFSATVNPLDWSSEQDAGYLPFGLQTYGSTPCAALGLYRSNLVAFNSEGYQMWQVDQDPANMALLDASPAACQYPRSVQPVSNDLVFLTPEGIRNIGIAGASTNLQAGFFGKQIDPLVLEKIRAGLIPEALFWPGAGQYWCFFNEEAFVLTMNGGVKDMSWTRYVFPESVDDWCILGTQLYLRAGDLVWIVSEEALEDDMPLPFVLGTDPDADFVATESGDYLGLDTLDDAVGVPFEGEVWWPYLDFGTAGVDKMLDSLDYTGTGEVSISIAYDQRRTALATAPYTVDGDTLPGTPVPIPVTAPSFQLRLTFSASQAWEWQMSNLYLS